jgi:IS5 family transposase
MKPAMKQITFSELDYLAKRKITKKERFLAEMEQIVPFARLEAVIAPHYPKTGAKGGRPPKSLAMMLRVYMLQNWFGYSDPGMEEALYDIEALRRFVGVSLVDAAIPDETTILNFRRLLETHQLTDALFAEINAHLSERGLILKSGTIVDATIIHAPPSTKNKDKARDPEMSSTHKHGQWYFGMKAHIGVDADSGAVHTVEGSTASLHDSQKLEDCLHGEEEGVLGDSAYGSKEKAEALANKGTILLTPIKAKPGRKLHDLEKEANRLIASPRSKVEHMFRIVKCQFGYRKTRFRGLAKNMAQLKTLFGLGNLYLLRKNLMQPLNVNCIQGA